MNFNVKNLSIKIVLVSLIAILIVFVGILGAKKMGFINNKTEFLSFKFLGAGGGPVYADMCNYGEEKLEVNDLNCLIGVADLTSWADLKLLDCQTIWLEPGDYTGFGNLTFADLHNNTKVIYGLTYPLDNNNTTFTRISSFNNFTVTDKNIEFVNIIFEEGSETKSVGGAFWWYNDSHIKFSCCLFENSGIYCSDEPDWVEATKFTVYSCKFDNSVVGASFGVGSIQNSYFYNNSTAIEFHPSYRDISWSDTQGGCKLDIDSVVIAVAYDPSDAGKKAIVESNKLYTIPSPNNNVISKNLGTLTLTNSSILDVKNGFALSSDPDSIFFDYNIENVVFLHDANTPNEFGAINHPTIHETYLKPAFQCIVKNTEYLNYKNSKPVNMNADASNMMFHMFGYFHNCDVGVYNNVTCFTNLHRNSSQNCSSAAQSAGKTVYYPLNTTVKNSATGTYIVQ